MRKFWIMLLPAVLLFAVVGCSDDDDTEGPDQLTSLEQFTAVHDALIDYVSTDAPAIKAMSADLFTEIVTDGDYTVLDFRQTADYEAGHIEGAHDVSLGNLLTMLESRALPLDKPFLCVCYTGQSAGHGVIALRALGYEAYSLKFGMCSWNSTLAGGWNNNIGSDGAIAYTAPYTTSTTYDWPEWDEDVTSEDAAVYARVDAMLQGGFKGKSYAADVAGNHDDFFILNYWGENDYNGTGDAPGHLEGAIQFTPKASLGMDEMLQYLPSDGTDILVYCWTGQTSSQMTAYLNMLGYDAYSMKFGVNNIWYDELGGHKWSDPMADYPLVTE